jgi:hypothetical protein
MTGQALLTAAGIGLAWAAFPDATVVQAAPGRERSVMQDEIDTAALQALEHRIDAYVTLHRSLEGPLPPLQVSKDMNVVREAMDALAREIRAARTGARQGDVFAPEAAAVLRLRIAACLSPEDLESILADAEGEQGVHEPLSVNAFWPEDADFNFVPPHLIETLPPLPPELQYRIIGRALVLWDHHANLIVDFLPGAFTN